VSRDEFKRSARLLDREFVRHQYARIEQPVAEGADCVHPCAVRRAEHCSNRELLGDDVLGRHDVRSGRNTGQHNPSTTTSKVNRRLRRTESAGSLNDNIEDTTKLCRSLTDDSCRTALERDTRTPIDWLDNDDLRGPRCARQLHCEKTDRAATNNRDSLSRFDVTPFNSGGRARGRFDPHGSTQIDAVRQRVREGSGNHEMVRPGAIAREARLVVPRFALRGVPVAAGPARRARANSLSNYGPAHERAVSIRPDSSDGPGPFVAGHDRIPDISGRTTPFEEIHVRPADASLSDAHEDLTGRGHRGVAIAQPQSPRFVKNDGAAHDG
jgi:hypothetical protein